MKKIKTVFLLLVLAFSASAFAGSPKKVTTTKPTPIIKELPPKDGGGTYQQKSIWDG